MNKDISTTELLKDFNKIFEENVKQNICHQLYLQQIEF